LPGIAVGLLGLALWFAGAPDPRFAYGYLVGVPLALLAAGAAALRLGPRRMAGIARVGCLALFVAQAGIAATVSLQADEPWPEIRPAATHREKTASGAEISVAEEPPGAGAQCWATPPPCTWALAPGLTVARRWGRTAFFLAEW
jgi:hypothetical protein